MRFASTWQMNHRYAAIVALFTLILTTGCASMKDPLKPVAHVDIPRYMGDWYVIANIPYFAEKGCFDSIESYALRSDGNLDNWFTCRKGSFSAPMKRKASAIAVIDDKVSNAVWHVKFFKIISVKYIILDLDPNYQWVAVGHPSRNYGWVMARKKSLDDATYQAILGRLATQGYDISRFQKVPQQMGSAQLPPQRRLLRLPDRNARTETSATKRPRVTSEIELLLLVGAVAAIVVFGAVWYVCLRVRNYGFLDVTWTLSIGLLALVDGIAASGLPLRRALFTILAVVWSGRLGIFVLLRVLSHHPREDKRYATLRRTWSSPVAFLGFFELQAVIAVAFSALFLLADVDPNPDIGALEWVGLALAAAGIVGEAVADAQASAFKKHPTPGKKVLDAGLWRYSRHPNYFFESVVWVGFAVAACSVPHGWLAIACPLMILYFLLRVTGIPLTEQHSLETHGDLYRDYQKRTSAFIPLPPQTG